MLKKIRQNRQILWRCRSRCYFKSRKNVQTAEICVIANGEKFRAETEDKDLYMLL